MNDYWMNSKSPRFMFKSPLMTDEAKRVIIETQDISAEIVALQLKITVRTVYMFRRQLGLFRKYD